MDDLKLSPQERRSGLQQVHGIDRVGAQGREEGDLYGRDAGEHSPDHPGGEPDVCQEPSVYNTDYFRFIRDLVAVNMVIILF